MYHARVHDPEIAELQKEPELAIHALMLLISADLVVIHATAVITVPAKHIQPK